MNNYDTIKSLFNTVAGCSMFRTDGPVIDFIDVMAQLATAVHEDDDTDREDLAEIWSFGENEMFTLGDLIAGTWWACTHWHGGQTCPVYALQCALGDVYAPGRIASGPEEDSCECWVYYAACNWFETVHFAPRV